MTGFTARFGSFPVHRPKHNIVSGTWNYPRCDKRIPGGESAKAEKATGPRQTPRPKTAENLYTVLALHAEPCVTSTPGGGPISMFDYERDMPLPDSEPRCADWVEKGGLLG